MHRPTRDDLLRVATGFWARLRIRWKWFTIRSFRKFNADDISAFITWFLMSQTLWIFVGTTTFFSVIFATANSLRLQEYVARSISNYLTSETGITIIFESAVVPKWKDSRISFRNVYISRRPLRLRALPPPPMAGVGEWGITPAASGHRAAVGYDVSAHPAYNYSGDGEDDEDGHRRPTTGCEEEDENYSMFDLNVDSIDVTLSLGRWFDGKGLIEDAVIKGVRGVLDRRSVFWDPDNPPEPAAYRHAPQPGDFELASLALEDVLVTVYQPGGFRPYTASIFRADIRRFRKQWLFYDFLRAENVVGQFDNCLFSLHKPQNIGRTTERDLRDGKWARMTRIRIDGVNIDHMQNSTTEPDGPLSWLTSGKVDGVLDIKFPRRDSAPAPLLSSSSSRDADNYDYDDYDEDEDDSAFNAILGELADAISVAAAKASAAGTSASEALLGFGGVDKDGRIPGQRALAKPPLSAPPRAGERGVMGHAEAEAGAGTGTEGGGVVVVGLGDGDGRVVAEGVSAPGPAPGLATGRRRVVIDVDLRFRDLKAALPLFPREMSYVNSALIRPIVAFMNAHHTLVPIHCQIAKDLGDFDGAWTMWETGLMDEIALKTYDALAYHVTQANMNRRVKAVGVWSLQMTASAMLAALRNLVDPMTSQLREAYAASAAQQWEVQGVVPGP
ncbi:mitochondrial distribution and morphology protein family 31 32 [Coniophora puteana RWD-64-598 SS2]|uniref:Mitochondrial distribution and morphology protein family 31 32 n=1 Tax=Coniophora puteana (strain RWD-64-598) TaxID=741705 RepID=A0A5M3MW27_CONPW|nr:mitochondrial distribution and morphology protein family 31 32 [Coniophora puteana RWD-64-598 SS2]EIW83359.1 mitochondrial distribution and morphology protein family 31 32 [Coniophora puteana RWD-64-598 SS2]